MPTRLSCASPPFSACCARAACVMSLSSRWEHHPCSPPPCWCAAAAAATASSGNSSLCYAIGPLARLPSCSHLSSSPHARAGAVLRSAVVNKEPCIVIQSLSGLSVPRVCVSPRAPAHSSCIDPDGLPCAASTHARVPAKGTGRSSGMLQVGDVIKRVDLQDTAGMQPDQVHQLLQGPPGSAVSVKYQRPPSNLEMRCELPSCVEISAWNPEVSGAHIATIAR